MVNSALPKTVSLAVLYSLCVGAVLAQDIVLERKTVHLEKHRVQDPTRPLLSTHVVGGQGLPVVSSIIKGSERSLAVLNGEMIPLGGVSNGYKLAKVFQHSVIVEKDGKEFELQLVN